VFAVVAALLVLVLSAVLAERGRAERQLEKARGELAVLAATDGLTGLANRRRLDEVILRECRRAGRDQTPLSCLLLDIDHFKRFNDQYGHQAGDEALRAVASVVLAQVRRPGDLAARYGGQAPGKAVPRGSRKPCARRSRRWRYRIAAIPKAAAWRR
jgi:diguanylate cyclase (GGDEF)-like protein